MPDRCPHYDGRTLWWFKWASGRGLVYYGGRAVPLPYCGAPHALPTFRPALLSNLSTLWDITSWWHFPPWRNAVAIRAGVARERDDATKFP